ncbi:MAG: DNA polymerase III subunit gamma/tau [Rickettsiales bacterium]|jgi:DNA polymerase-3 subunit gamma/tau|nr:DNA polymerase III subunit gamma/tau [Rickettsiales bacterium]
MSENYTVLARKYRSQNFESLIGQDVLVKTLTTAIKTDRIAHAYMLTGIRGTGKTSTARILAKALNCLSSDRATATPCGTCDNCRAIAAGQHIDVIEIDAASHTGVDNMRDMLESAGYRPTNGRYKVYIIDEVHMLSTGAFNALLKTLEEPPAHVVFILATTEIRKVPVTILSRCQRFDLARVPVETLKKHFAMIADSEQVELSDAADELIARAADGSVRDGLSLLDQAIAQTGGHVDEAAVLGMLKRADRAVVLDFMKTILSGDTAAALTKTDELYNSGADMALLLTDIMEWTHWATRMHPALRMDNSQNTPYTADGREQIAAILKTVSLNTLSRLWQVMVSSTLEIQTAGNQKQAFDMLVVRLINIAEIPDFSVLLAQDKVKNEKLKVEIKEPNGISTAENLTAALQEDKELMLLSHWNNNLEIMEFSDGNIRYCDRKNDAEFMARLKKFLRDKTGRDWILTAVESQNKPTIAEEKRAEIASDPAVAAAIDLFGATII